MSDIAAALMNALGIGPKKEQKPVLSAAEEEAPWLVPQGGAGGPVPQGGSEEVTKPPSRLEEIDQLLLELKKEKQRQAFMGGSPIPR